MNQRQQAPHATTTTMDRTKRLCLPAFCLILATLLGRTRAEYLARTRRLSSNYKRSNKGYTSSSSYYSSDNSKNTYYSSNYYSGARDFSVCDGSVVKVLELYILCDSPYTFYYGNGANRHSPVCNYGDKISFEVRFRVTDDIQQDRPIYTTIAIYDDQEDPNLLVSTDPANLCDDYVGSDCTSAGYYRFTSRTRLPYPSSDSSSTDRFLPQLHVAFSTQADFGYNLGAMNIECEQWDEVKDGTTWLANKPQRTRIEALFIDYSLLLLSCGLLSALGYFLWRQAGRQRLATTCSGEPARFITLN